MNSMVFMLLLLGIGILLLIAELFLPTHGVLGVLGLISVAGAIGVVFTFDRWLGLAVLAAAIVGSPFIGMLSMKLWARSPIGRKIVLPPVESPRPIVLTRIGQIGATVTDLRPIGECDFGEQRIEAASELGIIPAGQKVRIVAVENGRPTVRRAEV